MQRGFKNNNKGLPSQETERPATAVNETSGSDNSTPTNVQNSTQNCKHFLRSRCGHGFTGKNPYMGKAKCNFTHPQPCRKLLKYGFYSASSPMGCNKGKNKCKFAHLKMCSSSVRTRECTQGSDCSLGYHIENTKLVSPPRDQTNVASAPPKGLSGATWKDQRNGSGGRGSVNPGEDFPTLSNNSQNSHRNKQQLNLGIRSQLLNPTQTNYRTVVQLPQDIGQVNDPSSFFIQDLSHAQVPQPRGSQLPPPLPLHQPLYHHPPPPPPAHPPHVQYPQLPLQPRQQSVIHRLPQSDPIMGLTGIQFPPPAIQSAGMGGLSILNVIQFLQGLIGGHQL